MAKHEAQICWEKWPVCDNNFFPCRRDSPRLRDPNRLTQGLAARHAWPLVQALCRSAPSLYLRLHVTARRPRRPLANRVSPCLGFQLSQLHRRLYPYAELIFYPFIIYARER